MLQKVDAILFAHITILAASIGVITTAWAQHRPVSHKALAAKAQMQPKCLSQRPIVTLSHHIMKVLGFFKSKENPLALKLTYEMCMVLQKDPFTLAGPSPTKQLILQDT